MANDSDQLIIQDTLKCTSDIQTESFFATVGIAVIILIVFGFTQRRRYRCQGFCCGLPSIIVPINLVQTQPHRHIYMLIFGAISGDILLTFSYASDLKALITDVSNLWTSTLFIVAMVVFQSLSYFPLFVGVNAPIPITGYLTGFMFSLWLVFKRLDVYLLISEDCFTFFSESSSTDKWILALSTVPTALCQSAATLWFLIKLLKEIRRLGKIYLGGGKQFLWEAIVEQDRSTYHFRRVTSLLTKPKVKERGGFTSFLWRMFLRVYPYDPNIQLPLRYLATIAVMLNIQYLLTLIICAAAFRLSLPLVQQVRGLSMNVTEAVGNIEMKLEDLEMFLNVSLSNNIGDAIRTSYDIISDGAYGVAVLLPLGPLLAIIWNTVLLAHMVGSVQKHLKKIAKGDVSFLPKVLPAPAYRLVASMRYAGYQIAYFIWTWILVTLVVWVVGAVGIVIYWLLKFIPREALTFFAGLIFPVIYSMMVFYVEVLVSHFYFITDADSKHTVINNRRVFHWVSYVLFFHNVILGLTSALLRIFYSIAFGLLLMFRLDRVVLMRGFESFDAGHKTYIGFLYLEHTQNNSVLNVFVSLLLDFRKDKKKTPIAHTNSDTEELCSDVEKGSSVTSPDKISRPRVSRQAANRWLVAYTLLRNKALQGLTAARLGREEVTGGERGAGDGEGSSSGESLGLSSDLEDNDSGDGYETAGESVNETALQNGVEPLAEVDPQQGLRDCFQEMAGVVGVRGAATAEDDSYHGDLQETSV